MRVSVHDERCVGSGQCVLTAPAVFDQNEADGVVVLLDQSPDEALANSVLQAARGCPAMAIDVSTE